jgi:hypothetical protein
MLEVFGTTEPDMARRSEYFGNLWEQWRGSLVQLDLDKVLDNPATSRYNNIVNVMSEAGYDQGFDYQKRATWVRFANSEVKAVFVLHYGDLIKQ